MNKVFLLILLFLVSCKESSNTNALLPEEKIATKSLPVSKNTPKEKFISNYTDSIIKTTTQKSVDFYLTEINKQNIDFNNTNDTIALKNQQGKTILKIPVDVEAYDNSATVIEITNHNLTNVKKILLFTIDECICGCNITTIYIIQTTDNKYIKLPYIAFDAVESGEPSYEYQFGKQNTIYQIEKLYDLSSPNLNVLEINKQKKLIWDGSKISTNTKVKEKKHIVTAINGLTIRDKPSLEGKKIGGLPYMSQTTIQATTKETLVIKNNDKNIEDHWVKIEYNNAMHYETGYIFGGFLEEKKVFIKNNKAILYPSCYNDKTVIDKLNKNWVELFKQNGYCYLATPKYIKEKSYNECTGSDAYCLSTERETLLFINDLTLEKNYADITFTIPPKEVIWSGNEFKFELNDQKYTLKASGNYTNRNIGNNKTYILSLHTENTTQIIFEENRFNDTVPKVIFIGDIDGDRKPDLIIESPTHYEQERKILLMSSDADKGKLLKKRATLRVDFSC